jgi:hypothetical protein
MRRSAKLSKQPLVSASYKQASKKPILAPASNEQASKKPALSHVVKLKILFPDNIALNKGAKKSSPALVSTNLKKTSN